MNFIKVHICSSKENPSGELVLLSPKDFVYSFRDAGTMLHNGLKNVEMSSRFNESFEKICELNPHFIILHSNTSGEQMLVNSERITAVRRDNNDATRVYMNNNEVLYVKEKVETVCKICENIKQVN